MKKTTILWIIIAILGIWSIISMSAYSSASDRAEGNLETATAILMDYKEQTLYMGCVYGKGFKSSDCDYLMTEVMGDLDFYKNNFDSFSFLK